MISRSSKIILTNTISGWASRLSRFAVSLVTLPIILNNLGKDQYGIWILVGQTIHFFALSDLGLTNSISRFVSRFQGQEDHQSTINLVNTSLAMLTAVSVVLVLLTVGLAQFIGTILKVPPESALKAREVFLISGLIFAGFFPLRIAPAILQGYQNYFVPNLVNIVGSVLNLAGVIILARLNLLGLIEFAILSSVTTVCISAINVFWAWRKIKPMPLGVRYFSKKTSLSLLDLGSSSVLYSAGTSLYGQGLGIAVGFFLGTAEAGIFGVVLNIMTYLSFMLTQITRPLITISSEYQARGNMDRLFSLSVEIMRVSLAMGLFVFVGLVFFGAPFLKLLLHRTSWNVQDYLNASACLMLMSGSLAVAIPQLAVQSIFRGVGQHWRVTINFLATSLVAFGVGVMAVAFMRSVVGAAVGWGLQLFFVGVLFNPGMICRYFKISKGRLFRLVYLPALIGACVFCGFAYLVSKVLVPVEPWQFLADFALCLAVGMLIVIVLNRGWSMRVFSMIKGVFSHGAKD